MTSMMEENQLPYHRVKTEEGQTAWDELLLVKIPVASAASAASIIIHT